jgi:hypothetical protein
LRGGGRTPGSAGIRGGGDGSQAKQQSGDLHCLIIGERVA